MSIVKQRLKSIGSVTLVLLALVLFSMPALIPIHDWFEYQGRAQGEIAFIEHQGDRCASIARFTVDEETYYSKSTMSASCRLEGNVNINYDLEDPARNSQALAIPLIYSLLFFTGVTAGLGAWAIRKMFERRERKVVPVTFIDAEEE